MFNAILKNVYFSFWPGTASLPSVTAAGVAVPLKRFFLCTTYSAPPVFNNSFSVVSTIVNGHKKQLLAEPYGSFFLMSNKARKPSAGLIRLILKDMGRFYIMGVRINQMLTGTSKRKRLELGLLLCVYLIKKFRQFIGNLIGTYGLIFCKIIV